MQRQLSPDALARDARFHRITTAQRFADERPGLGEDRKMDPVADDVGDRARRQMHGIFVGEIQALEGAGRTAFDYADGETPFAMKLDMARQCWDEARHVEISVKLGDHMGTEIGEYSEAVTLFEAACHPDPVFRLAGVNRALEGLAIDVFTTMRDFADEMHDPVLRFCEDWMLADEVTHVKMGSTWLRELTKDDADRRQQALEFQKTVDGLFNFRGLRGEERDAGIRLARRFRELAGFDTEEIDAIAAQSAAQRAARLHPAAGVAVGGPSGRGARLPHTLDVLHRLAELGDPVALVTAHQPDAPGQRLAAAPGDAGIDERVEHEPLGHPQARHGRHRRHGEDLLPVAARRSPRHLALEAVLRLAGDRDAAIAGGLAELPDLLGQGHGSRLVARPRAHRRRGEGAEDDDLVAIARRPRPAPRTTRPGCAPGTRP